MPIYRDTTFSVRVYTGENIRCDPFMVDLCTWQDYWKQKQFNSLRCGQGCRRWAAAKMAHSLVFHSRRLSGQFTAENCPELWSIVGSTNQHLTPRWWTNTEAMTRPAVQLSSVCTVSDTVLAPPPQSLEQLSTPVSSIETKRPPWHPPTLQTIHVSSGQTSHTLRLLTLTQTATCWMDRRK